MKRDPSKNNDSRAKTPGFYWRTRVRYSEVDAQALAYFAHHLTYYDCAITELFRSLPFDYMAYARKTGYDFNVASARVDFRNPVHLDDELDVSVRIGHLGNSSITFQLALHPADTNEILSEGEIVWVHADQEKMRSARLPDEIRTKLEPHVIAK